MLNSEVTSLTGAQSDFSNWVQHILLSALLICSRCGRRMIGAADSRDQRRYGTVNLIGSGRDKAHEGWVYQRLYPSGHAGDLGPGLEGLGPGGSILGGRAVIAAEVEEVADLVVGREEALGLAS